jgi:hypothetical protein
VSEYLGQAKGELEQNAPNLPLAAALLSGADRSQAWLYTTPILLQRSQTVILKLRALKGSSGSLENLEGASRDMRNKPSAEADEALRSALEDALTEIHEAEREGVIEEDLQVRRLRILLLYLSVTLLLLLAAIPFTTTEMTPTSGSTDFTWPVFALFDSLVLSLVAAAIGLAFVGAAGGVISGMLRVRNSRAQLLSYRASLLNLALRPLTGAVAAVILYIFLSWNVVKGLEVTSPGIFVVAAFLAGFSERYFLRIVRAEEQAPSDSAEPVGCQKLA